ncbi:MAG TPA: DUF309 domain-containing protein [Candidatus Dormibacteraeota bacterium]
MADTEELLGKGVALFNDGLFWEAHEAWEEAWTPDRHGPDRGFWKGLIQLAAGCLHYTRRNRRGAVNKWRSGLEYLEPYLPEHHGLPLEALHDAVADRLDELENGEWGELALPPLRVRGKPPPGA